MIGSKDTTILPMFFLKLNSKTSNTGMWCLYPEARDWNTTLRTQILIWASISEV